MWCFAWYLNIGWHFNSKYGINLWQRLCLKRIHHCLNSRVTRFWITVRQTSVHVLVVRHSIHTKRILSFKSRLTHHSSHVHNFSYLKLVELKLHTHLDERCISYVSKYYIVMLHHFWNFAFSYTILSFETPGIFSVKAMCVALLFDLLERVILPMGTGKGWKQKANWKDHTCRWATSEFWESVNSSIVFFFLNGNIWWRISKNPLHHNLSE